MQDLCREQSDIQPYEPGSSFQITECISSSSFRPATNFLTRVFSSRNRLASSASLMYFVFHAESLFLDTPSSRATSPALRPQPNCLSAPMICASVCLFFAVLFRHFSSQAHSLWHPERHTKKKRTEGQVHSELRQREP